MATQHPEYEHALPAYGAFKPADVDDARRRRPGADLREYADGRGLELLESRNPVGYWGVVPGDDRLQFNVLRGVLPSGRHGILLHHAREVEVHWRQTISEWVAEIGAKVHDLTVKIEGNAASPRDLLKLVPVAGNFVHSKAADKRPQAAGVPTTVGATLVPQVATLPVFQFVNYDNSTTLEKLGVDDRIDLDRYGFPGMWVEAPAAPAPDPDFVERLMATSFADVLRTFGSRAYLRARIHHGQLGIAIDGYVYDRGVLDGLAEAVTTAATGIAEAARPMHRPQPFTDPLPDADWPERHTPEQVLHSPAPYPPQPYVRGMLDGAEKRGWVPEDSIGYHLAFPDLPVPGTAFAVMRFTPPGTSEIGRVAWHAERPMSRYNVGRNAVLLPAAGVEPTPPGGVRRNDLNLNYAVAEGIFAAWQGRDQDPSTTMVGMDTLLASALQLRAEL